MLGHGHELAVELLRQLGVGSWDRGLQALDGRVQVAGEGGVVQEGEQLPAEVQRQHLAQGELDPRPSIARIQAQAAVLAQAVVQHRQTHLAEIGEVAPQGPGIEIEAISELLGRDPAPSHHQIDDANQLLGFVEVTFQGSFRAENRGADIFWSVGW